MRSKSVSYTVEFEMNQTAGVLFPLFSPEGEKLWVPGWEYENVMGKSDLHQDYVFLTKSHDHAVSKAVWIVSKKEKGSNLLLTLSYTWESILEVKDCKE